MGDDRDSIGQEEVEKSVGWEAVVEVGPVGQGKRVKGPHGGRSQTTCRRKCVSSPETEDKERKGMWVTAHVGA